MRKRIVLSTFFITVLCLILFFAATLEVYYHGVTERRRQDLEVYMNLYRAGMAERSLQAAEELSLLTGGARVTFLTSEGVVTADSDGHDGENAAAAEEIKIAMAEGEGFSVRKTGGKTMIFYCRATDGVLVRIGIETSVWTAFGNIFGVVGGFAALFAVICVICACISAAYALQPLETLAKSAVSGSAYDCNDDDLQRLAVLMRERDEKIKILSAELADQKTLAENMRNFKNEFVANVTHEMNTPLTSIRGFAELLSSGNIKEEQREKAVNAILVQSERLTALIASIINYNEIGIESTQPCEVNVSKIVREILAGAEPDIAAKNLETDIDVDDDVIVLCSHEAVTQIAGNLIRNAIRYNKHGGKLSVRAKAGERPLFVVEDTGIGIAESDKKRIFDRFFTVDKSHGGKNGGFGLGLAIVKKLCEKWGFEIEVESEPGVGTKMSVRF